MPNKFQAQLLLMVRDALVQGDINEAYHNLALLADRGRCTLEVWDEWEKLAMYKKAKEY